MIIKKYENQDKNENDIHLSESIKDNVKSSIGSISRDNRGQGAAEYILLFGGVIVIALAGLLIYRSYFSNNASGLNATQDISSIRNNVSVY